jgi:hypothetical protein
VQAECVKLRKKYKRRQQPEGRTPISCPKVDYWPSVETQKCHQTLTVSIMSRNGGQWHGHHYNLEEGLHTGGCIQGEMAFS